MSLPPGPGHNWRGTILGLHPSLPPTSLRAEPGPPWWYPRPRSSVPAGAAPRWTGTNFCSTIQTSPEWLVTRAAVTVPRCSEQKHNFLSDLRVAGPRSELDCPSWLVSRRRAVKVQWSWWTGCPPAAVGTGLLSGRPSLLRSSALRSAPQRVSAVWRLHEPRQAAHSRTEPRRKRDERGFKIKAQRLQKLVNKPH